MSLFTLGLSRLVPLLFAASAVLVLGRLAYDRLLPRHARAARAAFALILLAGAAAAVPWVRRGSALVSAERAFERAEWDVAADRYAAYARLRGSALGRAGSRRALALMNLRRWAEAEAAFLESFPRRSTATVRATPNDVLSLGLCRYYTGRFDAAERTMRALAPGLSPVRDYVLGRILERRGEPAGAISAFRASLGQSPCFYPSLYHLVRALRAAGRGMEAAAALDAFCPGGGTQARERDAVLAPEGPLPPDKEFYFVQEN
jgi:tetratricopeptide (TPR) repeat protein